MLVNYNWIEHPLGYVNTYYRGDFNTLDEAHDYIKIFDEFFEAKGETCAYAEITEESADDGSSYYYVGILCITPKEWVDDLEKMDRLYQGYHK